jgi:hypothetical protein
VTGKRPYWLYIKQKKRFKGITGCQPNKKATEKNYSYREVSQLDIAGMTSGRARRRIRENSDINFLLQPSTVR